jgi:hypothetical protein
MGLRCVFFGLKDRPGCGCEVIAGLTADADGLALNDVESIKAWPKPEILRFAQDDWSVFIG